MPFCPTPEKSRPDPGLITHVFSDDRHDRKVFNLHRVDDTHVYFIFKFYFHPLFGLWLPDAAEWQTDRVLRRPLGDENNVDLPVPGGEEAPGSTWHPKQPTALQGEKGYIDDGRNAFDRVFAQVSFVRDQRSFKKD